MFDSLLSIAEQYCLENQHRLTAPRAEILKIIQASAQPLTAYAILDRLAEFQTAPKPPTVYRALEFWQKHGFVHRIVSLNAYIACSAGHRHTGSQFLICDDCSLVKESHLCELPNAIQQKTAAEGFQRRSWHLEIHGLCQNCQKG